MDKQPLAQHSTRRPLESTAWRAKRRNPILRFLLLITLLAVVSYCTRKDSVTNTSHRNFRQRTFDGCSTFQQEVNDREDFVDIDFEEATQDDVLLGWEGDWVAYGTLPFLEIGTTLGRTKFDAVVSWVNGSEPNFAALRKEHALRSPLNSPDSTWLHDSLARHREWSQVQWSLLSCRKNIESLNKLQILGSHRQVPEFPHLLEHELKQMREKLEFVQDATLFNARARSCALPTFNSVAIEVNMGNMPSDVDKFIYLCDDMMLTTQYRDADIYTPLFGLSMIIYDGLVWNVDIDEPYQSTQPNKGEYPEYSHSSMMFNKAFGKRNRAYVRHATKVYSRKLLREVERAFPAAYADASLSRFRGDRSIINPHFHAHHYVIERHRKALLWSFLKLKSDVNGDGFLSWTERKSILDTLEKVGADFPAGKTRSTLKLMNKDLYSGGFTDAHALKPKWSSFDGPSYSWFQETVIERNPVYHEFKTSVPDKPDLKHRCVLNYDKCFGPSFFVNSGEKHNVEDLINRFARDEPSCGDCLINKLVLASGSKGLNAVLPSVQYQDLRDLAVKAIMRYSYTKNKVVGNMIILGPSDYDVDLLKYKFEVLTGAHEPMPAQMCVNDDVPMNTPSQRVDEIGATLHNFYRNILDPPELDPLQPYETPVMPKRVDYL